jgi:hypothetical protein
MADLDSHFDDCQRCAVMPRTTGVAAKRTFTELLRLSAVDRVRGSEPRRHRAQYRVGLEAIAALCVAPVEYAVQHGAPFHAGDRADVFARFKYSAGGLRLFAELGFRG